MELFWVAYNNKHKIIKKCKYNQIRCGLRTLILNKITLARYINNAPDIWIHMKHNIKEYRKACFIYQGTLIKNGSKTFSWEKIKLYITASRYLKDG